MTPGVGSLLGIGGCLGVGAVMLMAASPAQGPADDWSARFRTADRCVACHNSMKTASGQDVSFGLEWRASIMANSSRDPYWQGSVRREAIDHPESQAAIEEECSVCHMPITYHAARSAGRRSEVFSHLPLWTARPGNSAAADGVSCSVCHQIQNVGLGTDSTFNGQVVIASGQVTGARPEYGPYSIDEGHQTLMQSSTQGFHPVQSEHIRESALCGTCHTLRTKARGPGGEEIGYLPEQMPFQEWLHSSLSKTRTCQSCHMPAVNEPVPITSLFGENRTGVRAHTFPGGNFFVQGLLNSHRDELAVMAPPETLLEARTDVSAFLRSQAARLGIDHVQSSPETLSFTVRVENLTGHKLPTAYPSRRAWLHVRVRDAKGALVFESGSLNPDGSISGNDNDVDPLRFEPHHAEITRPDAVQVYEPILGDAQGKVTTGLLSAIGYLKDNRLLPSGFDKRTAMPDIAVVGAAADDPDFTDRGDAVRYRVGLAGSTGPYEVTAALWYQPIGFRWAHNLESYPAAEPRRFVSLYSAAARTTAVILASATVRTPRPTGDGH